MDGARVASVPITVSQMPASAHPRAACLSCLRCLRPRRPSTRQHLDIIAIEQAFRLALRDGPRAGDRMRDAARRAPSTAAQHRTASRLRPRAAISGALFSRRPARRESSRTRRPSRTPGRSARRPRSSRTSRARAATRASTCTRSSRGISMLPAETGTGYRTDTSRDDGGALRALWPVLTRAPPPDTSSARLVADPAPARYVVPGGRFREIYYWDSYFTMLGLVASGRTDLVREHARQLRLADRAIRRTSPTATAPTISVAASRRSSPRWSGSTRVRTDTAHALRYLGALEAEHAFWMDGAERLAPGEAYRRVVRLTDGSAAQSLLGRSGRAAAGGVPPRRRAGCRACRDGQREAFYRNVRATAESGWDFSSRWMRDPTDLRTLETTDLVAGGSQQPAVRIANAADRGAADLPCAAGRRGSRPALRGRRGRTPPRNLLAAAYDPATGFFYDVRWRTGERVTAAADAGRRRPSLLRTRHARAGARGGRATRPRLPPAAVDSSRRW